jgi:glycerol-3-phosphate dehydrogenase subunit B
VKTDIAVVGSGLAALVATRAIQQAGRDVVLVWPGLSSLYFLYATVDVLGYAAAGDRDIVGNPGEGVARLIADNPGHPYERAGMRALEDGAALLLTWLSEAGLRWEGALTRNLLLPTATGAAKPSCLVPATMAAGDLGRYAPIVLCGFDGYQDFAPELAASNLARSWPGGGGVRSVRIALPGVDRDRLFTSIDLARRFEDGSFRDAVADRLRQRVDGDGSRVGVPAVLGLTHDGEVHADFEANVGHPVFEIPTLPPSVLGLRLFDRLRKHLQETGIELIWAAPAHAAEVADGRCRSIRLKSAGREQPLEARTFVLALEDIVDGALRAGVHTIQDPFFNQTLARHGIPTERTDENLFNTQPFARVGYRVSDRLQPIDERGAPFASNVFVAGGAIAGYDPAGTKSRGGLAVATGYRAAQEAMAA